MKEDANPYGDPLTLMECVAMVAVYLTSAVVSFGIGGYLYARFIA